MLAMRASLCFCLLSLIGIAGQLSRTFRRRGLVAGSVVMTFGAALVAASGASAAGATVVDCSTTNLQTAIDNAAPGAKLAVVGTCPGSFAIDQDLTLLGQGTAVLAGQQAG